MAQTQAVSTRALVLGGDGVTGIAREIGVLAGLAASGVDLTGADAVIGTSAGPFVGAAVAGGHDLEALAEAQGLPDPPEIDVSASQETIVAWFNAFGAGGATGVGAVFGEIAKANPEPVPLHVSSHHRREPACDDGMARLLEGDRRRCRHRSAPDIRSQRGGRTGRRGNGKRGRAWSVAPGPDQWPIMDRWRHGVLRQRTP
jgi:hypothetical protein